MGVIQYEVWHKNDNHSGYPVLVTPNKDKVDSVIEGHEDEYEVRKYVAYPVI